MPSDVKVTPVIYTGPLKTNLGDGVSEQEGRSLLHVARVMLGQAVSAADAVGQQTTSSWRTFENGITVRVARVGGLCIADFVRHPVVDLDDPSKYDAFALLPYGGVVLNGYFEQEPKTDDPEGPTINLNNSFSPSDATLRRLGNHYRALERLLASTTDPATQSKIRLDMRYLHHDGDFGFKKVPYLALRVPDQWKHLYNNPVQPNPLAANPKPPKVYSQYRLIKPTMYSGRMRVVAQILLGLGKQTPPDKEQQKLVHPEFDSCYEDYRHDKEEVPEGDKYLGSLDYWFHWTQTHGVYRTDGGRYYLIQISTDGVWAMRLPVLSRSKWALPDDAKDYLGDLPLGYAFPSNVLTESEKAKGTTKSPWDRALEQGWIKQIMTAEDIDPFYSRLQATYLECGWAFSMSGKKADNVGWRVNAPRPHDYPVFEHWSITIEGGDAGGVEGEGDENSKRYDYSHDANGYDKSITNLRATIKKISQGNAVDVSLRHKPFKVPEIDQDTGTPGVVSFDMNPRGFPSQGAIPPDYQKAIATYPVCDTTVHVFYDDEELVWIRYYNPMNTNRQESDSWDDRDYQPYCMVLGGYTWGSYTRNTKLPKGFYSSRNDPRKMADESRTEMQSAGRKTWESPYMGVEYSWPYPPFHFGYEQSNVEGEWYNSFDASYRSRVGSPWTAKRHCFHVHVWGTRVTGQSYAYSCALPLTDREAGFICERHVCATRDKIDYQYAAMVMQFVYHTYPSWITDPYLGIDTGIIPVGNWEWWQLRDDTVKYLAWRFWDDEYNYTKEQRQPTQTVLNIVSGTHTAPTDTWDRSKPESSVEEYTIYTLCSKLGGEYPKEMKASAGASALWEEKIPDDDGTVRIAHFWCTRSVVGNAAAKQHIYLNGKMEYVGVRSDKLSDYEKASPHQQVTFVGET